MAFPQPGISVLFSIITIGIGIVAIKVLVEDCKNNSRRNLMRKVDAIISNKLDQVTRRSAQLARAQRVGQVSNGQVDLRDRVIDGHHILCKLTQQEQQLFKRRETTSSALITQRTF